MANEKRLDLIDRNAVLDLFTVQAPSMTYNKMYMTVANAPTVDAVEVVHGHWLECEGTVCSVCNKHFFTDGPLAVANYKANYCPSCGARMDGGVEDGC